VPAAGSPFSTPNLGAALLGAGRTFIGYSEDLPAVGSTVGISGNYARKHNPWVNWQNTPQGTNQLPPDLNKPFFTSGGTPLPFYGDVNAPTDYSALPHVSIVVPNLQNDMHDGTIAQADTWLINYIQPYADWAVSNNSLLIVTWDEDESASRNLIPTIFHGPMIVPGNYPQTWTLHNILRTVEDMYGTTHSGSAGSVRPIVGCFNTDGPIATKTFRQGGDGYVDAHDTYIEQANPNNTHTADTLITIDGSPLTQGLIRFENIIGNGVGQLPQGVTILSAKLMLLTGSNSANGDTSLSTMLAYRMLSPWTDTATWNSLVGGVSADGTEASATADFGVVPNKINIWAIFDVTGSVQASANDPNHNYGWLIQAGGTDEWRWRSSDASLLADRPVLDITYDPTSCRAAISQQPAGLRANVGDAVTLTVSAAGTSPLSYQWRIGGVNLSDGGSISGATTSGLTIDPVGLGDAGSYDVVVTNPCGPSTSLAASLIVCPQAPNGDLNGDGFVDGGDIAPFVGAVLIGSTAASDLCPGDFSLNLVVDEADSPAFVSALLQ
jgi:Phosphoesterase family/Immunoglobulin I-set domain